MTTDFHSLIGGIEAVIFFIENRSVIQGRVAQDDGLDSQPVKDAVRDLREIKNDLLLAETKFMTSVANREHIPAAFMAEHPNEIPPVAAGSLAITGETSSQTPEERRQLLASAREEWKLSFDSHWNQWRAALDNQAEKFANAIYSLQNQAPEWSALDRNLSLLMESFRRGAENRHGTGDPSDSWPGHSSSSSPRP